MYAEIYNQVEGTRYTFPCRKIALRGQVLWVRCLTGGWHAIHFDHQVWGDFGASEELPDGLKPITFRSAKRLLTR